MPAGTGEPHQLTSDSPERNTDIQADPGPPELFHDAAELALVGGWELDITKNSAAWSAQALRIHGIEEGAQLSLEQFVESYPLRAAKALGAAIEGAIGCGEQWDIDLPYDDASGRKLWIRSIGKALSAHGSVYRLVGAFQDITAHKDAEQQLNRYATDAEEARSRVEEQAVQLLEQAVDLERARSEALESARLKGQFLANMSHEIRTPMNGIVGMAELLEGSSLDSEQREYLRTIRFSAASLLTIINDILDFSKIEAGKLVFESVLFNLEECIEEAVGLFAEQAASKRTQLATTIDPSAPITVVGDPGRLRQVLLNLLSNAVKFTIGGDVELRVDVLEQEEGSVRFRFCVRDSGIGISRSAISSLFSPFMQADGSTTRKYGGTGLGLAICKQLASGMGGRIGVESEPGTGSTFWFTALLGYVDDAQSQAVGRDLSGMRVLGLECHEAARLSRESDLELWGVSPEILGDPAHFVSALQERHQDNDVILLDVGALDAVQLELEARGTTLSQILDKPVIVTGTFMQGLPTEVAGVAVADRLRKPFKRGRLCEALRMAGQRSGPEKSSAIAPTAQERSLDGLRVLVAEDNPVNQKVAMRMLSKLGCAAYAVANGAEALEAVQSQDFDVVLMDCQMPEMDGFEATRRIRELGLTHTPPILALTANAMQGDKELCLQAGMDDYLTKPIGLKILAETLSRWSSPSEQAREDLQTSGTH
jgi:two-component system sensor histidine kinase/response regulator